eukprot:TRINITY_DN618_c0_g1_i13.p1 TRINITY_DN618_c0_g1~~TRINITY_DN618_c0_g1_i13.p1  ORF type:complete len:314 (-),score=65.03 TRINITY_DN618_c0_g1_i13:172-1113(-)
MHRYLIQRGYLVGFSADDQPANDSLDGICRGLDQANKLFGVEGSVIVMVVQPGERNTGDQRHVEYYLWEKYKVPVFRRTLHEIGVHAVVDPVSKRCSIDGYTVGVFYLRAGYSPQDHPTEIEWAARLTMEMSAAFVCPNIRYHLCGTKKMQQVWTNPGVLEKFLSQEEANFLRSCFAGQYSLDTEDNPAEIISQALKSPDLYVMKPQREGGGNLLSKEKMCTALRTLSPMELQSYIIMDKILPVVEETYFLSERGVVVGPGISELGTYSVIIADEKEEYVNESVGVLLRTKSDGVEDGGVCSGIAFLNSVVLK